MAPWARCITIVMLFCCCAITIAQENPAPDGPELYLDPESDRSVWLGLYVTEEPDDPARVSQALGRMVGVESPEEVADFYDGYSEEDGASWSVYWYPELNPKGLLINGQLELESLRAALTELGLTELLVQVGFPDAPVSKAAWRDSMLAMTSSDEGFSTRVPLAHPIPGLSISYGFTPLALAVWYWPVLLCFMLLLAYAWYLRYSALKRPESEAGAACIFCTRRSMNCIIVQGFRI